MNSIQGCEYDVLIIGAGAFGGALAQYLGLYKYRGKVLLLEQHNNLPQKRWSFWNTHTLPDFVSNLIEKSWSIWTISYRDKVARHQHPQYNYFSVNSADFFVQLEKLCDNTNNIELKKGEAVTSIKTFDDYVEVSTHKNCYRCRYLIDTRPPDINQDCIFRPQGLYQCFVGYELEFERDIFDESTAVIMKELKGNKTGVDFLYILPFSSTNALIELTTFNITPVHEKKLKSLLDQYLEKTYQNISYKYLNQEAGNLPMFNLRKRSSSSRVAFGGIAAGTMRASTGYSFLNNLRVAQKQANALIQTNTLLQYDPVAKYYRFMDEIMLKVIINKPEATDFLLFNFSSRVSSSTYARFMTEQANIFDLLKIISVMPKKPFIKACWQVFYENLRNR